MPQITYLPPRAASTRLEPADLRFCRIANRHHEAVKLERQNRSERIQIRIYQVAKKTFAFAGCMLFLVGLWMLA